MTPGTLCNRKERAMKQIRIFAFAALALAATYTLVGAPAATASPHTAFAAAPVHLQKEATMVPTIGRIVHYTLSAEDAEKINRRREHAARYMPIHVANSNGVMVHVGNRAAEGQVLPMVIVAVWGETEHALVNGKVLLDGSDEFWATSRAPGPAEPGKWSWPPRA